MKFLFVTEGYQSRAAISNEVPANMIASELTKMIALTALASVEEKIRETMGYPVTHEKFSLTFFSSQFFSVGKVFTSFPLLTH